ncbi:PREDICTED: zinc finger protein ZAT1-like [Nicotiana attenuata]|uniref:Zinc finger protein zat4 n=1 Tax=Nicotiana attenuata TaxID=49451 RepID=A0A1J6IGJ4_NICAT|nr:PREDICTED: zinc finger protein ZAT1-like [Nicotiana attenuata]OIS99647.1 zinc finger protein zat4 [Nicotiana attenuata]
MEKHKCKLCSRKFLNGKALGGHMRSHLMALPLPPKTPPLKQDSGGGRSHSTLSLYSSENQEDEVLEQKGDDSLGNYGLRENPKRSFRMIDPEFLDGGYVVQDRESETESTKKPTCRRSNRSRKMVLTMATTEKSEEKMKEKSVDFEPLSLFSDSSSEEDIAMCLMMLSKDVWKSSAPSKLRSKHGKKYQCGICRKMFKTSQALGSHKTIHKIKNSNSSTSIEESEQKPTKKLVSVKNIMDQKLHECPFCGKLFQSGQALGGHKRSHLIMSSSTTGSSSIKLGDSFLVEYSNSAKLPNGFIDLNMPAPMEDEDFSQPDFSAISDAEFQHQENGRG